MATKGYPKATGARIEEIFDSIGNSDSVKELAKDTDERDSVILSDVIDALKNSEGALTLKFPSAEGHHYITYAESGELVGIYSGPFGPENRPASMSQEAIEQFWKSADNATVEATEQTPLAGSVVGDLLKE